jgi:hypothetical protein
VSSFFGTPEAKNRKPGRLLPGWTWVGQSGIGAWFDWWVGGAAGGVPNSANGVPIPAKTVPIWIKNTCANGLI